jgi:phosphatidyl-myo-inositol dimannoside synthase
MPKRLLLVLTEFPPSFGGMQTHALEFCSWLHQQGYGIEVATYRLESGPANCPSLPFPVHRILSRISYQANLKKLEALAKATQADLIYSSTVYYGELANKLGLPVFCRSAGNDVQRPWIAWPFRFGSSILDQPWMERHLYRRWKHWNWPDYLELWMLRQRRELMRHSARSMRWIFANSEFTKALIESEDLAKGTLRTLPGGVDTGFFAAGCSDRKTLGLNPSSYYLITACRLVEKKGLDILIQAVHLVREQGILIHLLIAGEGPQRHQLERLVEEQNLQQAIHFLGYLDKHQLRSYFHSCDLFVLSSRHLRNPRNGFADAETMGRALCEASACGLPLLASRSGGIPSVVEDGFNGLLAEENSPIDLANKLQQLWHNRDLAKQLGQNGAARARQLFDWQILFAAHEEAIRQLLP